MGKRGSNDASRINQQLYTLRNIDRGVILAQRVRLAATSAERRKGLLGVSSMDPECALWIHPCEAIHTFGMKMRIDVIFLDREYRVKKLRCAVGPNHFAFCVSASSVVELAAGAVSASGTQLNDRLQFD